MRDKSFNIAKNPQYDEYESGFASMVYKVFDEKTTGWAIVNGIISNKWLAEQLQKPIITKFEKRTHLL